MKENRKENNLLPASIRAKLPPHAEAIDEDPAKQSKINN